MYRSTTRRRCVGSSSCSSRCRRTRTLHRAVPPVDRSLLAPANRSRLLLSPACQANRRRQHIALPEMAEQLYKRLQTAKSGGGADEGRLASSLAQAPEAEDSCRSGSGSPKLGVGLSRKDMLPELSTAVQLGACCETAGHSPSQESCGQRCLKGSGNVYGRDTRRGAGLPCTAVCACDMANEACQLRCHRFEPRLREVVHRGFGMAARANRHPRSQRGE